jgi:hypothetical protein
MKMNLNFVAAAMIFVLLFCSAAYASDESESKIFHAAQIASTDYQLKIKDKELSPEHLYAIYSKVENYSIGMSETEAYYVVVFLPKKSGRKMNGGGGEYLIRKSDFGIERFLGYR